MANYNNNNNNYSSNRPFTMDIRNCGFIDPQAQLSAALMNKDIREFRNALDMGARPTAEDERNRSIFEKALSTPGCAEFVDECLHRGCNINYINQHLNKAAINFATDSRDPQIVAVLLQHHGVQIDRKYVNLTPLNSLAKNLNAENAQNVIACIKLLLNYGASANMADHREMTPLHYILNNRKLDEHKKRELVQLFLDISDIDIDTYRNGEVRNLLMTQYAELRLPAVRSASDEITAEMLLRCLRSGEEAKFVEKFAEYQLNISEKDNLKNSTQEENLPFFIESIKRGMFEAFDVLLASGLNINMSQNSKTPIEIAIIWGNWRALEKLLRQEQLQLASNAQLLNTVIGKIDKPPLDDFCDYRKCFDLLLASERVDINETDASGTTPLHYAVKYRNATAIKELLKHGAYIGMKSVFADLPIDGMHPELLEDHFNNCITTNGLKAGEPGFEIQMNYKNLIYEQKQQSDNKPRRHQQQLLHDEMTPFAFIAASKEHRHLLQHPLITSFLFLKWHRLSIVFYINFLLYVFFAVSFITHTILKFRESDHVAATALFGLFSWIGIIYMIIRESIQFIMSPLLYFRSITNYLEIGLIVLSILTCIESTYDRETQRVIAVVTILLVAMELCLLVGSLPVLSISTHMLMLRAVSTSFLKSFTLYSIFVITFSLCFYILFGKVDNNNATSEDNGKNNEENNEDNNGEFNKFANPFTAVIKTIVMLTGEFDAGDIDFQSYYSYLLFLLFVFTMSIVLFNLLNGLAVSDTQTIKAQAELNGALCRTELLTRYENVLTGRSGRTSFIVNHEPFRSICRRLMKLYPNYITGRQIAILPNDSNKVLIPITNSFELKDVISSNGISNTKTKANFLSLPNSDNSELQKRLLDPPVKYLPCCCSFVNGKCSAMDNRTVKLALAVLDKKEIADINRIRQQDTERRLQLIEHKLDTLLEFLQQRN